MKHAIVFCAAMIAFLAIPVAYSTLKGYTRWYWDNYHAEALVDGNRVRGYLHESNGTLILTRTDTAKPHSYLLNSNARFIAILDCGKWYPPSFLILPVGDMNLCTGSDVLGETVVYYSAPEAPIGPTRIEGVNLEFHTTSVKEYSNGCGIFLGYTLPTLKRRMNGRHSPGKRYCRKATGSVIVSYVR